MKINFNYSVIIAGICFISTISLADILTSNLVAHLPFNSNANDVTGNGHDGTVFGATLTTDRFGNENSSYNFDGINDYIDLGLMGEFKTVSLWVRQEARSGYEMYFGHDGFRLFANDPNSRLVLGDDSANNVGASEFIDNHVGEWIHLVAINDGINSKIYFNGLNVTEISANPKPVETSTVNLGRWPGNSHYINGQIDDVRIYNKALTQEEVTALYAIPEPGTLSLIGLSSIFAWFMRRRFRN